MEHGQSERLERYHQRLLTSLMRKEAAFETLEEASGLCQDTRVANFSVEFRLDPEVAYVPGRWERVSGLGAALERYVERLGEMERVRFGTGAIDGLTPAHHEALEAVIESAEVLARLGWPVNWEQNVQVILELTEYGLRDGRLVDRYSRLPDQVCLGQELLLLGSVTFFKQSRTASGKPTSFKPVVFSGANRTAHEATELRLRADRDDVAPRFRYVSEWLSGKSGSTYRIAV
ncbi:hypothetical protein ASG25_09275 [Rhizobium sp. Leaf384]|uniref:hypothetical protein n=1 Tax=Rhizobium sp. Leaf384 TaxID=1736358 RepID=UPI0007138ED3|nr:hypothetical protein [Rhizobium sp. Leaf384]KQS78818.1 hypothetical protein ASG25_09275 [Rhizobium sp. Leaf384]